MTLLLLMNHRINACSYAGGGYQTRDICYISLILSFSLSCHCAEINDTVTADES